MRMIRVGRALITRLVARSRQRQLRLRYLASLGLAAALVATIATPANADIVKPRAGEGFIAATARVCGSSAGWQANQARAGTAWMYLSKSYDIRCGQSANVRAEAPRASRGTAAARSSGWVHPLPNGARAANRGACPGAPRSGHTHAGIDLTAPSGLAVRAVAGGRVILSRYSNSAGWYVKISHPGGATSTYMHLRRQGASVGTNVSPGATIGVVGATGNAKGPHLHFEATGAGNSAQTARANGLNLGC